MTLHRGNRLLERLPESDRRRLLSLLKPVALKFDQVLYESGGLIKFVYFPTGAVLSALTVMEDGNGIEVATIGLEGLVGYFGSTGGRFSPHKIIVQIGDGGLRMEAQALREEIAKNGPLKDLLADYHVAFMAQVSQSVACNGLHTLEKRCCRWLLMSLIEWDRTTSNSPTST